VGGRVGFQLRLRVNRGLVRGLPPRPQVLRVGARRLQGDVSGGERGDIVQRELLVLFVLPLLLLLVLLVLLCHLCLLPDDGAFSSYHGFLQGRLARAQSLDFGLAVAHRGLQCV
jgi:hypothetical protein